MGTRRTDAARPRACASFPVLPRGVVSGRDARGNELATAHDQLAELRLAAFDRCPDRPDGALAVRQCLGSRPPSRGESGASPVNTLSLVQLPPAALGDLLPFRALGPGLTYLLLG